MKINKIVHYSDLHLKLYKHHAKDRTVMEEAIEQWKKLNPDRIVFTGDLVHSKNQMTPELINLMSWWMTETSKICKCIYLIGNHDFLENNVDRLDAITPIVDSLNNPNIVYYKDRGTFDDGNIKWCVYSLTSHNVRPDIDLGGKQHKIGLFHGPIEGSTTDIGFKFDDGFSLDRFKGLDVVLSGDIHKRQEYDIGGGNKAYMVGSTICQNFGESVGKHGYGVYTIDDRNYKYFDLDNLQPYLNFKISDIEDINNGKEILING
jgi:DNA repair exonuclease SbcCD nuclease subunit